MKKILSTIAVLIMAFTTQANEVYYNNIDAGPSELKINPTTSIDLLSIKKDIETNRRAYYMTGSVTVLKAPKTGDVASSLDLSFRNSVLIAYPGRNYVQANAQAKRNDTNRNNEIRIYVHHNDGGKGKVDLKNVKINWKSDLSGEIVGKLSNVTVLYQENSILITGSFQKNGYTLGVSLAISKEVKLI